MNAIMLMLHILPTEEGIPQLITLPELLEDPIYKDYFLAVPKFRGKKPKYRLYVQLKGQTQWRSRDYDKYSDAFNTLKKYLKANKVHDAAICCKSRPSLPPQRTVRLKGKYRIDSQGKRVQVTARTAWKPKVDGADSDYHIWCGYCRRPTAFRYYSKHHALMKVMRTMGQPLVNPSVRRCVICGSSEELVMGRLN